MTFHVWYAPVGNYTHVEYLVVSVLLACDFDIDCVALSYLDIVLVPRLVPNFYLFSSCAVQVGCALL